MIAGLKEIWKNAFGDPDWYINFFFENRFEPENTMVFMEDGKPVSMFFMLPAQINSDGSYKNAFYIYGVSTMGEYQGRGYSRALLKSLNDNMPTGVSVTFLTPATSSLFDFYKKQNYKKAFSLKEMNLTAEDLAEIPLYLGDLKSPTAAEYAACRDAAFDAHGYIKWDERAIKYMLAENELLGGKAYISSNCNPENIIFYRIWDKKLFVKETTFDGDELLSVLKKIMADENVPTCNIKLHSNSKINAEIKDFAMVYGIGGIENGYFNLALD